MSKDIILSVDRDGWSGLLQLSINDENGGKRLAGPKFNGSSKNLLTHKLTEADAEALIEYAGRVSS